MPQPPVNHFPPIPDETVHEGGRWRHHKPTSAQVAEWFTTQPLDDGMGHDQYVGGVVIIPQSEKVKYSRRDGQGTVERYEMTFTPYVQIGTRVAYFTRLSEFRGLIPVIKPAEVPRTTRLDSPYFNANMPEGLWWHVIQGDSGQVRYLCATTEVAMYTPKSYMDLLEKRPAFPMRQGQGTKQVSGYPDMNQIAKAQTGATGRALGVAGILVIGTGIASAEDMMELTAQQTLSEAPSPTLPTVPSEIAPGEPPELPEAEQLAQLRSRALALQTTMQERTPIAWREFVAWWNERKQEENWGTLADVPLESLRGVYTRMVTLHDAGAAVEAKNETEGEA